MYFQELDRTRMYSGFSLISYQYYIPKATMVRDTVVPCHDFKNPQASKASGGIHACYIVAYVGWSVFLCSKSYLYWAWPRTRAGGFWPGTGLADLTLYPGWHALSAPRSYSRSLTRFHNAPRAIRPNAYKGPRMAKM